MLTLLMDAGVRCACSRDTTFNLSPLVKSVSWLNLKMTFMFWSGTYLCTYQPLRLTLLFELKFSSMMYSPLSDVSRMPMAPDTYRFALCLIAYLFDRLLLLFWSMAVLSPLDLTIFLTLDLGEWASVVAMCGGGGGPP